jgi:hypothetical protein
MIVACLPLPSAPPTSSRETAPKSRRINRATEPKKTPEAPLADQHDWRILAERLTQVEPEFIYNAAFSAPTAEQEILATPATEAPTESSWKPGRDMPPHLARLCERKLLTPQQERDLFRRMNYAKFRLAALRQRIDPNKPSVSHQSPWPIATALCRPTYGWSFRSPRSSPT